MGKKQLICLTRKFKRKDVSAGTKSYSWIFKCLSWMGIKQQLKYAKLNNKANICKKKKP
jgi:hypothetical protein